MKIKLSSFLPIFILLIFSFFSTGGGCPSNQESLLDEMKFALDECSPVANPASVEAQCNTAVLKGEEIIALNATDNNVRLLLSTAYFGRSGLDFLDMLGTFSDLSDTSGEDFDEIRDAISSLTVDIADLRSSITVLSDAVTAQGLTADDHPDVFRQLGLMRALEAFIRPIDLSGDDVEDITTTSISDAEAAIVESDFLNADNNLADTGIDDTDILTPIRENYCRCSVQTGGFTAACLRDLMRCELYVETSLRTGATDNNIEGDYNDDNESNNLDCLTLVDPGTAAFTTCRSRNTE